MKKLFAIALVSAIGMAAGIARADDIKIAIAGPITGSDAAIGEQMRRGGVQAVQDINAKGGLLGKQLDADDRRRCVRSETGGRDRQ